MTWRIGYFVAPLLLLLTSCGASQAPVGRWEGFIDSPTWIIAVRLQVEDGNAIRASALSANVEGMSLTAKFDAAHELKAALNKQWPQAIRGQVDFRDGTMTS